MNSVFSFIQPNEPETPGIEGTPDPVATIPISAASLNASFPASATPDMTQVLKDMLATLEGFLPTSPENLPSPTLILLKVNDAPVGLGDYIGTVALPLGQTELKGGRLAAIGRFILWGTTLQQANELMLTLQGNLLTAKKDLWNAGFLTFVANTAKSPQFDPSLNAWARSADYTWLYEYQYIFSDAAQSLIARIPIHADQEVENSPNRENTLVTDELTRWDNLTAPALAVRGPTNIGHLSGLIFATGTMPSGAVTLTRTFSGAPGAPTIFPTLPNFLNALSDPITPIRHAQLAFATFQDFLNACTLTTDSLTLGDWNEDSISDEYQGYTLTFAPTIPLLESADRLEIIYGDGTEPLNQVSVIYLRIRR